MLETLPRSLAAPLVGAAESGLLPDALIRYGIRRIVVARLTDEVEIGRTAEQFAEQLSKLPVAVHEQDANLQHYEVPSAFFEQVLGARLKYSCALFSDPTTGLDEAEEAMLALTCERAELADGMRILELGCGWGSLTLWMAEHYPQSTILAVSNSATQREFILARAAERGLHNVEVRTANVATLELESGRFDRVVSVEMFEHMRNWPELYSRIGRWLAPEGRFFKHVFCHRSHPYFFEDEGEADWMARNFFSGGVMPSFELPGQIEGPLELERCWKVGGEHYARTAEAWLQRIDARRDAVLEIFDGEPGFQPRVAVQRWRMFFMACAELFGYANGEEWCVGHYLLRARDDRR